MFTLKPLETGSTVIIYEDNKGNIEEAILSDLKETDLIELESFFKDINEVWNENH